MSANGKHPAIDWNAALAYWLTLDGKARSYAAVARKFGCTDVAVGKAARRFKWAERLEEMQLKIELSGVVDEVVRVRAERIRDVIRLADMVVRAAIGGIDSGRLRVELSDVAALVKLSELVEGEATSRVDASTVQEALRSVLELALAAAPADKHEELIAGFERMFARGATLPAIEAREVEIDE